MSENGSLRHRTLLTSGVFQAYTDNGQWILDVLLHNRIRLSAVAGDEVSGPKRRATHIGSINIEL